MQKKGKPTAKLSQAKEGIESEIAKRDARQSELRNDLKLRSEEVDKQITELGELISAAEKNPIQNKQTKAQLDSWNKELASYKKEKKSYVKLEEKKEATREEIYNTNKTKLYIVS